MCTHTHARNARRVGGIEMRFVCQDCRRRFKAVNDLARHMRKSHPSDHENSKKTDSKDKELCPNCKRNILFDNGTYIMCTYCLHKFTKKEYENEKQRE